MDLAGVGQGHPPVFLPSDFFEGRGRCFILVSGPLYSFGGGYRIVFCGGGPVFVSARDLSFFERVLGPGLPLEEYWFVYCGR